MLYKTIFKFTWALNAAIRTVLWLPFETKESVFSINTVVKQIIGFIEHVLREFFVHNNRGENFFHFLCPLNNNRFQVCEILYDYIQYSDMITKFFATVACIDNNVWTKYCELFTQKFNDSIFYAAIS